LEITKPDLAEAIRRVHAAPVVKNVALRLSELAGPHQPPLIARSLRGGAPREDDWTRTPVQPTILCSTVDQVGSRLLFRGYGVSDRMKPIHAGLLGSDCLILLDEAHLSEPFRQTLAAITRLRAPDEAPFGFAVLTATPSVDAKRPFALGAADYSNPMLSARITAGKPARLSRLASKKSTPSRCARKGWFRK
jgi:CRISPR-associated endonuclease/helicase Cas3